MAPPIPSPLRGRSAIVGAATHGIGESPGQRPLDQAVHAARKALADAGLTLADVDALFVCTPDDALLGLSAADCLGIQPQFTENNRTGGSAFHSHLIVAARRSWRWTVPAPPRVRARGAKPRRWARPACRRPPAVGALAAPCCNCKQGTLPAPVMASTRRW